MKQLAGIQAVSVGHALDTTSASGGVVHSVFAHAVNLVIGGDLWTLLAAGKADLPFGIRTGLQDFDTLRLRSGDPVNVRPGFVGIGTNGQGVVVDCRGASRWVPASGNRFEPGLHHRLAVVAAITRERSWHGSAQMALAVRSALGNPGALSDVLTKVVGCGPGATPSGDDVLVGILAVLTSPLSGAAGAEASESLSRLLLPLLPKTTDVSAHLLRQAAYGLFGRPVHELVSAVAGDPTPQQLQDTVLRVVETGATSGADTCEGLLAFAPPFFIPHDERAAA
jgi:hypothetical protein